ncbi:unnamed protein product [Pleuronectes platessa]|uniref:Uncharacterized protein n=1 Tax=Pleuronectes platessa TaxID=8262 RepID=A0A9N7ZB81_PLEPL|nr:unnamed protein product [Pleuronectes platessa]
MTQRGEMMAPPQTCLPLHCKLTCQPHLPLAAIVPPTIRRPSLARAVHSGGFLDRKDNGVGTLQFPFAPQGREGSPSEGNNRNFTERKRRGIQKVHLTSRHIPPEATLHSPIPNLQNCTPLTSVVL